MNHWINIARVGKWTDMSGRTVDLTREKLSAIADGYDPRKQKAPLVFGHPQTNSPAYGWAGAVRMAGDVLQARIDEAPDAVRALVASGAYRYVSMALSPAGSLRHIGLLGAVPPAIDGLGEVALAEDGGAEITFAALGEETMELKEAMDKITELEAMVADLTAQLEEAKKTAGSAEAELAAYREARVKADREARFAALVAGGLAMPHEKEKTLMFAAALAGSGGTIAFAAPGGAAAETVSLEEAFWRNLEGGKSSGLTAEFATRDRRADEGARLDLTGINDYA